MHTCIFCNFLVPNTKCRISNLFAQLDIFMRTGETTRKTELISAVRPIGLKSFPYCVLFIPKGCKHHYQRVHLWVLLLEARRKKNVRVCHSPESSKMLVLTTFHITIFFYVFIHIDVDHIAYHTEKKKILTNRIL